MSRSNRRFAPTLDRLESLNPPSGTVSAQVIAHRARPRPLTDVHGEYLATQNMPDMGRTIRLQGDAWFDNQGSVPFTGNLTANGFVARGRAGGSIVFAGRNGTMTVELSGPVRRGPSDLPSRFTYRVTKADADFAGYRGAGTAVLALADAGRFSMTFRPGLARG